MTDIDSALNGVLGAVDATAGASAGTTSLTGPEVTGYLDRVYALEDPNYGDVGTNSDIADALNADAEVLGTLKDAVKGYREVVDTMVTPALAAQAADAAATPTSAAVFPIAGAGSADELLTGASQAFATLSDGVADTEVRGSGGSNEAKSAADDAGSSEGDTEDGEDSGIAEKSALDEASGDVSADELATQVSSAAPAAAPVAAPMGGLTGAAPNPGALLTSLSAAAPMMSGMFGGTPAMGTSGVAPVGGSMGSLPSSTAAPSTSSSSRGVSTAEILQMIRDAKSNAASTHTSSAGSSLSSPSSSHTTSTFSPSRIGDTGSSAGNAGSTSTPASGSSSSSSSGPSAPAVGRTVAGGAVDPSLVSGRSVSTSLSAASPSSGGGAAAMAGRGAGGMGMMPMGAMGGMGGAGGGSGSGSSSSKYLERLGELRNDNPYLNGTWARGRTVSSVMGSAAGSAAAGDQDVASSLASPGTRGTAAPSTSVTELRSKWA